MKGTWGPGWSGVGLALTTLVVGIGIGRTLGARGRPARPAGRPALRGQEDSHVPMESWRGSGLAEDVGVSPHDGPAEPDEAERQRRMEEAREQLGLPDPDARTP
ncbi:MAG TPA: hypothetical protein VE153_40755 [Myxococcus sp.]|nr:hypothetical protein [Myxococcus sp.]